MNVAPNRVSTRLLTGAVLLGLVLSTAVSAAPRLESDRDQIQLRLTGPLRLSGTTPMGLEALPAGHYRLNLIGPGVPSSVGRLTRGSDGRLSVGPMSGPLALMLPPGYLHLEQGEAGRALSLAGVAVSLAGGFLIKEIDRGRALDDRVQAELDYANAITTEEFLAARLDIVDASARVADSREVRNILGAAAGYTWLSAAIETWLMTSSPRLADRGAGNYALATDTSSGSGALVRSLLLPGGGQRYLGRSGRGNLFLGAVGGMGLLTVVAHDRYLSARRDASRSRAVFDAATNPQEIPALRVELKRSMDRISSRNRLRWAGMGATLGFYVWNILDTRGLSRDHAAPGDMSLDVRPAGDGMLGQITWRLP